MLIVSIGDNLHEMSNLFSGKNKNKYFDLSTAENFIQHAMSFMRTRLLIEEQKCIHGDLSHLNIEIQAQTTQFDQKFRYPLMELSNIVQLEIVDDHRRLRCNLGLIFRVEGL